MVARFYWLTTDGTVCDVSIAIIWRANNTVWQQQYPSLLRFIPTHVYVALVSDKTRHATMTTWRQSWRRNNRNNNTSSFIQWNVNNSNFYSKSSIQFFLSVPRILSINNVKKSWIDQIICWTIRGLTLQTPIKNPYIRAKNSRDTKTINDLKRNSVWKCGIWTYNWT
jgi:hypothetical protein